MRELSGRSHCQSVSKPLAWQGCSLAWHSVAWYNVDMKCLQCGTEIEYARLTKKYCNGTCRKKAYRHRDPGAENLSVATPESSEEYTYVPEVPPKKFEAPIGRLVDGHWVYERPSEMEEDPFSDEE